MVSALEQQVLFAVAAIVLTGTLAVFVWRLVRMNRRDRD